MKMVTLIHKHTNSEKLFNLIHFENLHGENQQKKNYAFPWKNVFSLRIAT